MNHLENSSYLRHFTALHYIDTGAGQGRQGPTPRINDAQPEGLAPQCSVLQGWISVLTLHPARHTAAMQSRAEAKSSLLQHGQGVLVQLSSPTLRVSWLSCCSQKGMQICREKTEVHVSPTAGYRQNSYSVLAVSMSSNCCAFHHLLITQHQTLG